MLLNEIKAMVILKNMTMTDLSNLINIGRRQMYIKIKKQDSETLEKIKKILS